MKRSFGWSLLLTVGMLLGMAMSPYQVSHADDPSPDDAATGSPAKSADANAEALAELKEIKTELKEINTYLRKGVVKTIAVMNLDKTE
jgi:hypothetical protein